MLRRFEHRYEDVSLKDVLDRPALFLSASVPYERKGPLSEEQRKENLAFVDRSCPDRVRDAVAELCRQAFARDLILLFGGHPAISPLVLEAADRFAPEGTGKRVVIFQSEHFREVIPHASLELANRERGLLLWTEKREERAASLTLMRQAMVHAPNLRGAIFIGGMEGLYEEAQLFDAAHLDLPIVALGSTGSAAEVLLERGTERVPARRFAGRNLKQEDLRDSDLYPIVLRQVLADFFPESRG
jgi:SLOG cluster3 family